LSITGSGIQATPTNAPNFPFPVGQGAAFFNSSTAGPALINVFGLGAVDFRDTSQAGTATMTAGVAGSNDDFSGGFIILHGNSTADHATITAYVGSNIEFHDASGAGSATLIAGNATIPNGAGNNGFIFFNDTSTADHATIIVNKFGELDFSPGFGPTCCTGGTSTAGNANITNNGVTGFYQGSSGGNATITTNAGGVTSFFGLSTGGNAAFITNAGGILDISGLGTFPDTGSPPASVPGMTAGSIEGAGSYFLGSKALTVGSNNLSTEVSGTIADGGSSGGTGGSLVKVGSGTLILSGINTYSGPTTVTAGTLRVTGSIAGSSGVTVNAGATLGGTGIVTGEVASTTINAGGTLSPGDNAVGNLSVAGNLLFQSTASYLVHVSPGNASSTLVTGSTTVVGTLTADDVGGATYTANRVFPVLSSTGPLTGTFSLATTGSFTGATNLSLVYGAREVFLDITATAAGPLVWSLAPGSSDWNTGGNWVGGTVPTAADIAQFNTSSVVIPTLVSHGRL
jgi:autotransporter-associated beta strand protein